MEDIVLWIIYMIYIYIYSYFDGCINMPRLSLGREGYILWMVPQLGTSSIACLIYDRKGNLVVVVTL